MHLSSLISSTLNLVILALLRLWKTQNLLNVILNVSGLISIALKILETCALPLIIMMLPSWKLNEPSLISSSSTNPRQLWKNINILRHRTSLTALPSYDSLSLLSLAKFFSDKIHNLHTSLLINRISASPHFPPPLKLVMVLQIFKLVAKWCCYIVADRRSKSVFKYQWWKNSKKSVSEVCSSRCEPRDYEFAWSCHPVRKSSLWWWVNCDLWLVSASSYLTEFVALWQNCANGFCQWKPLCILSLIFSLVNYK